jgi:MFS family permease
LGLNGGRVDISDYHSPIFTAPLAGWLADVWPSRWLTALWFPLSAVFVVLLVLINRDSLEGKVLLCVLLSLYGNAAVSTILHPLSYQTGFARVFGLSPLGADLSRAVASMERDIPDIFGHSGANGQVFALYTSASAAGVLAGPAVSDLSSPGFPRTSDDWYIRL